MTSEQRAKEVYPKATVHWSAYNVWIENTEILGSVRRPLMGDDTGTTERYESRAWADAWRNIQKQKGKYESR
jgi:hypothetical protein